MKTLRDYQLRGIEMLRDSLRRGKRRPVLQLPTGAGKTLLSAALIDRALAKGQRCIFTVPRISLVDQTVDAFLRQGVSQVGVIQQAHEMTDRSRPVQVASIDSLMRRDIPPAGLVIVDEAHLQRDFLYEWMRRSEWQRVPFIGLSATPWTKGMAKHWDDLVVVSTTEKMIEAGYLSPFRAFAPSSPDLTGVGTERGDYVVKQLSAVMDQPKLVADVVTTWLERGEDRPTLCFAVDRSHAKHLQQKFQAAGVPTGYVDAYSKPEDRALLEKQFRSGEIRVACSVGVLTTGVDWDVRCISLARPTKSEMLYVQMIGRGLRPAPGKDHLLLLDHSDSTLRLGFPDQIHHNALDDGNPRNKADKDRIALPKPCPSCHYLKPPKMAVCPSCGFRAEHGPKAQEVQDGELIEITAKNPQALTLARKGEIYGQLKAVARKRGYSSGWASHKFREMTGVWPNAVRDAPERDPDQALLNWIRGRQRAFAKLRGAGHTDNVNSAAV